MDDWDVEYSDKRLTTVHPADKKITVCENRVFGEIDGTKQKNHEFSVHGLRAINGCCQDFGVFQIGFPDYLATEEDLAVYAEKIMGSTNGELERDYAGRALAVDSVFNGDGFKQTFDMLKTYDMTDDQAWGLALRAHRFIKDHVYVDGFLRISRFVEDDENLEILYVGKIGIDDLELIRKLLDKDIVKSPPYLPGFIDLL